MCALDAGPNRIGIQTLHETVARDLLRRIARGTLAPGASLPTESQLAQSFGCSRTVVREAVRVLVAKGLVEVRQGSGTRVRPPAFWQHVDPDVLLERIRASRDGQLLDDLFEVRRLVEGEAAALAAERRSDTDLRVLGLLVEAMAASVQLPTEYVRHDVEFHNRVFLTSGNTLLREITAPVLDLLRVTMEVTVQMASPATSLVAHRHVYEAIAQRDGAAARRAMQEHLLVFEGHLRHALLASLDQQPAPRVDAPRPAG